MWTCDKYDISLGGMLKKCYLDWNNIRNICGTNREELLRFRINKKQYIKEEF